MKFEKVKWIWLDKQFYPEYQDSAYTYFCDKKPYCVAVFEKQISISRPVKKIYTAISADRLTDSNLTAIMEKVMTDKYLTQPQPYFMHFVLQALDKVGLFGKYGIDAILKWQKLLDECDSLLKKMWNFIPGVDYSHAWSATPA